VPAILVDPGSPARDSAWPLIWRSTKRCAIAMAAAAGVVFAAVGVVFYQARSQAMAIAHLEEIGCNVHYAGPYLGSLNRPGTIREWLREQCGEEWFGDVEAIYLGYSENLSPQEMRFVCDAGRRFKQLKSLAIHSDQFAYDQIRNWPHLKQLETLTLHSDKLTDDDLEKIARLPHLKHLDIQSSGVSISGVRKLAALPELHVLQVHSIRSPPTDSRPAAGFPHVTLLDLSGPEVDDAAIISLGSMPELAAAMLDGSQVGDAGVAHLTLSPKLTRISLSLTKVTDASLETLANCPELTEIDCSNTAINGRGLAALANKRIADLNLSDTAVTDDCVRFILGFSELTWLKLRQTNLSGLGLADLENGPPKFVDLSGARLSPEGIKELARAKCSVLSLARTPINDQQLMLFAENDHIERLEVTETSITAAGVRAFYEARKRRLKAAGREETLNLDCDFPDEVAPYLPAPDFVAGMDGAREPSADPSAPEP